MDHNFKINETFFPGFKVHEIVDNNLKKGILKDIPFLLTYDTFPTRSISQMVYSNYLKNYLYEPIDNTAIIYLYLINNLSTNFCLYIKDGNIYSVKHRFKNNLFKGTLFECQRYPKNIMYVTNLLIHNGIPFEGNLDDIIRNLNDLIDNSYQPDPILDPISLEVKPIVQSNYIKSLIQEYQPKNLLCRHPDGKQLMILTGPFDLDQEQTDKEEKIDISAISSLQIRNDLLYFRLKYTDKSDVYHLYSLMNNSEIFFDLADVASIKTSRFLRTVQNNSIVLCRYNPDFNRWCPVLKSKRKRPDPIIQM